MGERGEIDDRYMQRGREDDYGDRGRQGYGYGGQSGSQAGGYRGGSGGYGGYGYNRESTGYGRDEGGGYGGYGRARMGGGGAYETTGYGYGGGYGMMNEGRGNVGDREGYQYRDRGGMGYGERGGGFGGGMSGGQSYGGVSSGRERDLGAYRDENSWRNEGYSGGHRGKGPSGYTRSDDRIKEDVCQALQDDDEIDATHIEITVKSGEVTLSGHVNDRRTKRMAEDLAERMSGVKDVNNNIRVQSENTSSNAGNGRTGRSESVSSSTDKDTEATRRPRA
jgi:hypothetical protein